MIIVILCIFSEFQRWRTKLNIFDTFWIITYKIKVRIRFKRPKRCFLHMDRVLVLYVCARSVFQDFDLRFFLLKMQLDPRTAESVQAKELVDENLVLN